MEMDMARANLSSMSFEALLRLREEIGRVLDQKAVQLQNQLSRLGAEIGNRGRLSSMKGRKVPVKYRDKEGNTWAGRGAQPVWLREKLKAGAKVEDFAVQKTAVSRKSPPRKTKKRRRKKWTRPILLPSPSGHVQPAREAISS
jgi:DNA-binding protein H-NS